MEFIIDNLVWFIAGGVVILMTIIGYFAEKTDFGKNLSSTNDNDESEKVVEPKKEKYTKKEKPTKKEKEPKKEEIKEEISQTKPVDEEFTSELPIPIVSETPVILAQQDVEPLAVEPMETAVVDNIPTEVSVGPITQEVVPVDLQTAAIEDDNMKIQPALEAEPVPQIYQETVTEIPTMENVIPDELPVVAEEVDNSNSVGQFDNVTEEPIDMTIPALETVNTQSNEEPSTVMDEKPVVITDEKVLPFDELAGDMKISPITVEQGIPAVNMELPNLETIAQDNTQSDEEDIWKF